MGVTGEAGEANAPDLMSLLASQNVLRHAGQWVAILDFKVIASGSSLAQVHEAATKRAKGRKPYFYPVPRAARLY